MSTENLNKTIENSQEENGTNATPDQATETVQVIDLDDPDAIAMAEASKAVEAEENENSQAEIVDNAEAEKAVEELLNGESAVEENEADPKKGGMIPKARFDEAVNKEREEKRRIELELAELKGKLSVVNPVTQPEPNSAKQTKSPDELISELETQADSLWKQVDDGEIEASDARKQERAIEKKIAEIEKSAQPEPIQTKPSNDLYLQDKINDVVQSSPAALEMLKLTGPTHESKWALVNSEAHAVLSKAGINPNTPLGLLRFAEEQVKVIEAYAPVWLKNSKAADPAPQPENKGLSPEAKQRAAKLALAERQPARTSDLGDSGSTSEMTLDKFVNLSEEEIDALPASIRNKFLED